jgi:pimeloyl-ACP methyl ester carboxylesterase
MAADLVHVMTRDGLRLDGAIHLPAPEARRFVGGVDLVLCIHGAGGNFYGSMPFTALVPLFLDRGLPALSVNTRGHDGHWQTSIAGVRRRFGAAFEVVDECRRDLEAWLGFARREGFQRIALVGHSLGAIKVIYALAHDSPDVITAAAISPACLSYQRFAASEKRAEFLRTLSEAESCVADGRGTTLTDATFPIPLLISAASYVDKYGPAERYNILTLLPKVTCPLLVVFGSLELGEGPAFQGVPEAVSNLDLPSSTQTVVIPGANHLYSGSIQNLAERLMAWLAEPIPASSPSARVTGSTSS